MATGEKINWHLPKFAGPIKRALADTNLLPKHHFKGAINVIYNACNILTCQSSVKTRGLRGDDPPSRCGFLAWLLWGRFSCPGLLPREPSGIFLAAMDVLKRHSHGDWKFEYGRRKTWPSLVTEPEIVWVPYNKLAEEWET